MKPLVGYTVHVRAGQDLANCGTALGGFNLHDPICSYEDEEKRLANLNYAPYSTCPRCFNKKNYVPIVLTGEIQV